MKEYLCYFLVGVVGVLLITLAMAIFLLPLYIMSITGNLNYLWIYSIFLLPILAAFGRDIMHN